MKIPHQEIIAEFNSFISISNLTYLLIFIGTSLLIIELEHKLRPHSPLKLKTYDWEVSTKEYGLEIEANISSIPKIFELGNYS